VGPNRDANPELLCYEAGVLTAEAQKLNSQLVAVYTSTVLKLRVNNHQQMKYKYSYTYA
jgi:hypothetical protein